MLTYTDIAALHQQGQTAEQIAAALAQDFRTNRDIDIARLAGELLIPTGLYSAIERLRETSEAAAQLYDLLRERRIESIRTATNLDTAANIKRGFDGLIADGVLDGIPFTPEQIMGAFYALGGGLKYAGVTAADVQVVIDAHAAIEARNALAARLNSAAAAGALAIEQGGDEAAVIAAVTAAWEGGSAD